MKSVQSQARDSIAQLLSTTGNNPFDERINRELDLLYTTNRTYYNAAKQYVNERKAFMKAMARTRNK